MSWVRHNVSKSKLQQNAFFKVASQPPPQIQSVNEIKNEVINPPNIMNLFTKKSYTVNEYDAASCMKYIDTILYISYNKDKEESIINEIKKIDPKLTKTEKIDAVKNQNNSLGITQSHITALQQFVKNNSWNTCLIVEDDFKFSDDNGSLIHSTFNYFFSTVKEFDMLMLATNEENCKSEETDWPFINRVHTISNKSAYIVTRIYLSKLIGNLMKSTSLIKKNGFKEEYAFENYWNKLSITDKWYSLSDPIGYNTSD
jgi:hypothetical protein